MGDDGNIQPRAERTEPVCEEVCASRLDVVGDHDPPVVSARDDLQQLTRFGACKESASYVRKKSGSTKWVNKVGETKWVNKVGETKIVS